MKNTMKVLKKSAAIAFVVQSAMGMAFIVFCAAVLPCMASETYYLTNGQADGNGCSSLNGTGGTWTSKGGDSHRTPMADNDYVAEDFTLLRTPEQRYSYQFLGRSLVLSATDDSVTKNCALKISSSRETAPDDCAALIVTNLIMKNTGICLATGNSIMGLAGQVTVPAGYSARLGVDGSSTFLFSLQANLKGGGTVAFPLKEKAISSLTGDNSEFTGDVTVGYASGLATHDGDGTLRFYSQTSWFGDAGRLTVGADSTVLEFCEDMSISTPNRTVDFGAYKPTIKVASDKTVVLNARLVGSNGFVKDGGGKLILLDASGFAGDITVLAGAGEVLSSNDLPRLSVGARTLILTYAALEDRFVGGSAWLAFGKGETAPATVPDASFFLLRRKLSLYAAYQAAQLVDSDSSYWAVLRYKTVRGATVDFPFAFHTLETDKVFFRDETADPSEKSCFTMPERWKDVNGQPLSQFISPGDYCIERNVLCRTTQDVNIICAFTKGPLILGCGDLTTNCSVLAKSGSFYATILAVGAGQFVAAEHTTRRQSLQGLVGIEKGAVFRLTTNTDHDYTTEAKCAISGQGKLIVMSHDTAAYEHTVKLTGDNGGLTGPVELTKGLKPLTVEFAASESWFGDMAVPTADGLKISDGTLVKFSKSFVGETPNRGIDLGTGTPTFEVDDGVVVKLTSPVCGGGFVKTGKGTLSLMSSQLKGISGTVRVAEGVLEIPTKFSFAKDTVLEVAEGAEVRYGVTVGMVILIY